MERDTVQTDTNCQQGRRILPASYKIGQGMTGTKVWPSDENKALLDPTTETNVTNSFGEASANIVTTASSVTSS
jgi:hypothetical protein